MNVLRSLERLINNNILDIIVTLIGITMIGIGLYKIYQPLMWIVMGTIFAFPGIPRKGVK